MPLCAAVWRSRERGPDLVVVMHGTGRAFMGYRDAFSEFGRWNNCIILWPALPGRRAGRRQSRRLQVHAEGDIRYDEVLVSIVEEVGQRYGLDVERFALFGYSGGGHFAHRFLMLHPERLWAASIGAPGSVTLLDPRAIGGSGSATMADCFGIEIDIDAMRNVPVQMVVGAADLETWEITHRRGRRALDARRQRRWATRPERLASLRQSFEAAGIEVRFDVVPNMPHDGNRVVGHVQSFFADVLKGDRRANKRTRQKQGNDP